MRLLAAKLQNGSICLIFYKYVWRKKGKRGSVLIFNEHQGLLGDSVQSFPLSHWWDTIFNEYALSHTTMF